MIEPKTQIEHVLDLARQSGVAADVVLNTSAQLSIKAEGGELSQYTAASSHAMGLRLIRDGRVGSSYTESLESASLRGMFEQAMGNAVIARKDEHQRVRAQQVDFASTTEDICRSDRSSPDEKIAAALRLEGGILEKSKPATSPYNSFNDVTTSTFVGNTHGAFGVHHERHLSCFTSALISLDGKQSIHFAQRKARSFAELPIEACIDEAYEIADALLEGGPIPTGNYDVILTTNALKQLFDAFGNFLSGHSAVKGLNPLSEKVGQSVAVNTLSIIDQASAIGGMAIRPFDDEGFPAQDTKIIEAGVLESLLHNSATAGFFGLETTGNARRGAKSPLAVAPRHLVIESSHSSNADLTGGTVFEVFALEGIHSGTNGVSGEFSLKASGFLSREGQRVQPVRGVTIAGNFYRLLHGVVATGETREWDNGRTFQAPKMRFHGCTVAGS